MYETVNGFSLQQCCLTLFLMAWLVTRYTTWKNVNHWIYALFALSTLLRNYSSYLSFVLEMYCPDYIYIYIYKNILTLNFTLHLFQRKKKISPFIFNIIILSKICNRLSNNLRNLISTRIPEILLAHSKKKSKLYFHLTILQNNNLQTYLPNSQKETCKKVARDREIFLLFDLVPLNGLTTRDSRIVKWNCDDYCTVVV